MIRVLIVLTYLFGGLAALFGLLLGFSSELEKYPIFKMVEGKKIYLFVVTAVCILFNRLAAASKEVILNKRPKMEQVQGPHGELVQKATLTGFAKELEEGVTKLKSEAEDYFNSAERDYAAGLYWDAANNYEKSINIIPTMSAYLNLGLALWYISDFALAEDAFISGLQIALEKRDRTFETLFRGNIGLVYFDQGKLEEALKSYQHALTIDKEIGNPLVGPLTL